jgi:hypothetical protein
MKIINEFKSLSQLRQYHLWSMFYGKTLNTAIIIVTTVAMINTFGSEGMVIKTQLVALYSLILLIPGVASLAGKSPVKSLKIVFVFEILSLLGFLFSGLEIHVVFILPISILLLNTTNLFMKSLIAQVSSIVISGESKYCDIQTKIDSVCTVIGAAIGLSFVYFQTSPTMIVLFSLIMLLFCRYFRFKTYYIIFGNKDEFNAKDIKLDMKVKA